MTAARSPIDKLRGFLNELSPEARAMLAAELERAALNGGDGGGMDLVLHELRGTLRGKAPKQPRLGNPPRVFFQPVEPFLVDEAMPTKVRGRIPRACLTPIWTWVTRDLVPADAKAFSDAVTAAMVGRDPSAVDRLGKSFQDHVLLRSKDAFAQVDRDEAAARKLTAQLGSPRDVEELRDLLAVMRSRDALAVVASRLPSTIKNLADESLENARQVINSPIARHAEVFPYALVLLMGRLVNPWQIIRLAIKAVETDLASRIAETAFAKAVDLAFSEMERLVVLLAAALKQRDTSDLAHIVKDLHDFARGFRTELDLSGDTPWSRRLAAIRKEIATLLGSELSVASGDIRRLLKPRPRREAVATSEIAAHEVAAADQGVDILLLCRLYAGEIALNEAAQRATSELNTLLDSGTAALIDGLRHAAAEEQPFRRSQLDAVIRLAGKVFGTSYAQLLTKSADLAGQGHAADPAASPRPARA